MKTKNMIIISCVLVLGIILSGLAFADSQGKGDYKGFGSKQRIQSIKKVLTNSLIKSTN